MEWEVFEDKKYPSIWCVEASDFESEGECYVITFSGPYREERAEEYHAWMSQQPNKWAVSKQLLYQ
jgi:hypothetical protein